MFIACHFENMEENKGQNKQCLFTFHWKKSTAPLWSFQPLRRFCFFKHSSELTIDTHFSPTSNHW